MGQEWVVLLEAQREPGAPPIDRLEIGRLRDALAGGRHASALCCPDRYALQVTVTAVTPVDALEQVAASWSDLVARLALPSWKLVRAEVFTPEELEREYEPTATATTPVSCPGAGRMLPEDYVVSEELLRRAFSDPLTGLVGREAFVHRLQTRLEETAPRASLGVVLVEVERAAQIDDRTAGPVGDEVAVVVAGRLASVLRTGDVLARVGANEYAVLLAGKSTEGAAMAVAGRMLEALLAPVTVDRRPLVLSARAGAAVGEPNDSAGAVMGKAMTTLAVGQMKGGGAVARPARPLDQWRPDPGV